MEYAFFDSMLQWMQSFSCMHLLLKHMALQQRLLIHVQYHIVHPVNVRLREYTQHMT